MENRLWFRVSFLWKIVILLYGKYDPIQGYFHIISKNFPIENKIWFKENFSMENMPWFRLNFFSMEIRLDLEINFPMEIYALMPTKFANGKYALIQTKYRFRETFLWKTSFDSEIFSYGKYDLIQKNVPMKYRLQTNVFYALIPTNFSYGDCGKKLENHSNILLRIDWLKISPPLFLGWLPFAESSSVTVL